MKRITRSSNQNGNAGGPYYNCSCCVKFLTFDDDGGNGPNNPATAEFLARDRLDICLHLISSTPVGQHYTFLDAYCVNVRILP